VSFSRGDSFVSDLLLGSLFPSPYAVQTSSRTSCSEIGLRQARRDWPVFFLAILGVGDFPLPVFLWFPRWSAFLDRDDLAEALSREYSRSPSFFTEVFLVPAAFPRIDH